MEPDDRWQKVAVLMISLGEELAAELLRQFSDEDVGHITQAIADLKQVPAEVQDRVLSEFEDELRAGRLPFLGGEGFAKGLLTNALGEERAREMWSRLEAPRRPAFEALEAADPDQVAGQLRREHPQTLALILSQLSTPAAAALLERLPADTQTEVAHRIATLEGVSPEVLEQVEAGLADSLAGVLSGRQQVGGAKVAADILNRVGARLEKSLMVRLDEQDPEIADDIRQRLFAFDDIARLSEADVRALIETVEMDELLVALKAAGKGVLDAVLSAVSERRRGRLKEDMAVLPKMRLSEVEAAQQRIVQNLRRLEAQGIVDLSRPADGDTWV
ncbi:MAG: flagellar motor switch protein FliG [Candidatus Latescibacterota bacterium]|jgi:flagellar motor switch protein FliG